MNKKNIFQFVRIYSLMLIGLFLIGSCAKERSAKTGWMLNSPSAGGSGFEKYAAIDQETGPGLSGRGRNIHHGNDR